VSSQAFDTPQTGDRQRIQPSSPTPRACATGRIPQPLKRKHRKVGENTLTDQKVLSPRLTAYLGSRLAELNMTRSDFIRKFHEDHGNAGSRNHLFKILNGQVIIGERGLLPLVIESLRLDLNHALQLLRTDKIEAKNWAYALPKANKVVQELATVMEFLSGRDQEEILKIAKVKAKLL
jgi:hypothetical protein